MRDEFVFPIYVKFNAATKRLEFASFETEYDKRPLAPTLSLFLGELNALKKTNMACVANTPYKLIKRKTLEAVQHKFMGLLDRNYILVNKTAEKPKIAFHKIRFELIPKSEGEPNHFIASCDNSLQLDRLEDYPQYEPTFRSIQDIQVRYVDQQQGLMPVPTYNINYTIV